MIEIPARYAIDETCRTFRSDRTAVSMRARRQCPQNHQSLNPELITETAAMDQSQLNGLTNFIWGIADDLLRDVYVRGKYRDVILPMTVLRRLDAVLEPTKKDVLEMKAALDKAGVTNQDDALRAAAGQAFYKASGVCCLTRTGVFGIRG